jgi:hypothetical protein
MIYTIMNFAIYQSMQVGAGHAILSFLSNHGAVLVLVAT